MTMTKKHYEAFAEAIKEADVEALAKAKIAKNIAGVLEEDNERFDFIIFLRACGKDVAACFGFH